MGAFKNEAEEWFARYLDAQGGYTAEYEPDLGVTTVPDFLVERDGARVVCEIKGFEKVPKFEERLSSGQPIAAGNDEVYGPIRGAVREAARNLKPLEGSGLPLVVVLANPLGFFISMDLEHLVPAMFGNLIYVAPFNPITGVAREFELELGRDGNLRTNHPYISAVMSLRQVDLRHEAYREWSDKRAEQRRLAGKERTFDDVVEQFDADARSWEEHCEAHELPNGADFRADVLVIESPFAARLPDSFFNGAGDRRTVVIREVIQPG